MACDLRESSSVEFKRIWNQGALKTVIAFANGRGGTLYLGIDDSGTPCSAMDTDSLQLQAINALRDSVEPNIMPYVDIQTAEIAMTPVVAISVAPAPNRPYFLASKGPIPAGTFIRQGPSTVSAPFSTIIKLMREDAPNTFEEQESHEQQLTFRDVEAAFARRDIAFGKSQMHTLGFFTDRGTYSNLALLLSDQCDIQTNCAAFKGNSKLHFLDRRECKGSLLRQFDEIVSFLRRNNQLSSYVSADWSSVDVAGVPETAFREAALNLLVHQDYAAGVTGLISIFDNSMEFVNAGGLLRSISESQLRIGCSSPRNRRLAEVFHRLGLIEAYGTGIPKMMEMYADSNVKPEFVLVEDGFKAILPNMIGHALPGALPKTIDGQASPAEAATPTEEPIRVSAHCLGFAYTGDYRADSPYGLDPSAEAQPSDPDVQKPITYRQAQSGSFTFAGISVTWREYRALEYAGQHEVLKRSDLQRELGMSQASIINLLRGLVSKGLLLKMGGGRSTSYRLAQSQ